MKLNLIELVVLGVIGFAQHAVAQQTPYERLEELFNKAGTPSSANQVYELVGKLKSCASAEIGTTEPRAQQIPKIVTWTERSQSGPEFPAVSKRALIIDSNDRPNHYLERLDSQGLFVESRDSGSIEHCESDENFDCRWSTHDERTYRLNDKYLLMKVTSGQKIIKFAYCWK